MELKVNFTKVGENVSIPLESGHIVIEILVLGGSLIASFNPLRIGSYCNTWKRAYTIDTSIGFNPLRIGSYCNTLSRHK